MDKWEYVDIYIVNSFSNPAVVKTSEKKVLIFGGRSKEFGTRIQSYDHDIRTMKTLKT